MLIQYSIGYSAQKQNSCYVTYKNNTMHSHYKIDNCRFRFRSIVGIDMNDAYNYN